MIGCLIAHDVDHRCRRTPGVVQVGKTVGEAGTTVEQCRSRLAGHAGVAIRRTGYHALKQAKHAVHTRHPVECRDEMHLGRAGIGKACRHATFKQRMHKALGAIHCVGLLYCSQTS